MIEVGQFNRLTATKKTDFGVFLDADDFGSVLLKNKFAPDDIEIGDQVDVFLYFDADRQVVATTEKPIAQIGEWGLMKVASVNSTGAFVEWGVKDKDLLVPFSEQRGRLRPGQNILVYVYSDKASGRIVGTTRFNKLLDKTPAAYTRNQEVQILIAERSDLGFKAIVNGQHWGMIFPSDVFGKLFIGKRLTAYIKEVREDGKINLSLQKVGVEKMDDLSVKILNTLEKRDGFLPLSDKSSPDAIFDVFRTSKGTFKKSIGALYKQKKIRIEKSGIYLVNNESK